VAVSREAAGSSCVGCSPAQRTAQRAGLEEWELQRLLRVLPAELHDALGLTAGGFRDDAVAKAVAAALGVPHPSYGFFDGAASHGGFTVERS